VVAEANPLIVCAAVTACFGSTITESFAGTATVVANDTSLNNNVYVPADAAVFVITIEVTIVVVLAGTVYNVALDVAAAPRYNALKVFAIIKLYH
jgi:hypothetical protein